MGLVSELRRRNVIRVAIAYAVVAWLLIEITATTFPILKLPDWSVTLVTAFVLIGFPLALILAWAYELTPEGLKKEKDVDRSKSITHVTGRKLDYLIIAVLVFALGYFAFDKFVLDPSRDAELVQTTTEAVTEQAAEIADKSIAVLPFVNMSADPEQEYFSDGLTDTLLHALTQLPDLKVSARTSSFFFKGQEIDVREIAEELGVRNILEGSVQRDGNKVRIVAQLIDANTGFHLWSNSYDLEMSNIFEVQDDVANRVALAMQVTLGGDTGPGGGKIRTVGTESVAAYEKYLKGLQQLNIGAVRNYLLAEIAFKEALALDADFYQARLHLAHTYLRQLVIGQITSAEASEYIRPLLERLLEERPDNGLALAIAANVQRLIGSIDVEKHLAGLTAAIERTPNEPVLYRTLGLLLSFANRQEEALQWLDRGLVVDPLDWRLHFYRGGRLWYLGRLDAAEASYERVIELNPDHPTSYDALSAFSWLRKQYAESFALSRKAMELDPLDHEFPVLIAINLYTVGLMEEGDQYLQRAITMTPDKASVRAAKLYRLLLLDDHSRVRDMSETLLRDDIDARDGAYWLAVMAFMSTMSEKDKTDQALNVLEELRPGVSSADFDPRSPKDHALQYFAVLALAQTQSQVEALRMLDAVVPRWDESFPRWRNYFPGIVAPIAMARGQMDVAVELILEDLESGLPQGDQFYRPPRYQHNYYYKALALEPPVAKRLAELDAEAKRGGEEIRAYIMENDLQL